MSFFKPNKTKEAVQESSGNGSKYISKSGIYPGTIKIASVDVNDSGARAINFNFEGEDGSESTFYGLKLDNNDGSENFAAKIFNRLTVIADIEDVQDPEEEDHRIGKDNKEVTLAVLPDFTDFECIIRVQEEYSRIGAKWIKNDDGFNIRKSMVIRDFYRADGAHAEEIVDESEIGVKIQKDNDYASNVTYRESAKGAGDAPTAEEVAEWKESKKSGAKPAAKKTAPKAAPKGKFAGFK